MIDFRLTYFRIISTYSSEDCLYYLYCWGFIFFFPLNPGIWWYQLLNEISQSVQLLNHVQLFANPWTAARQAFLSITKPRGLLKLISIVSVMPSNHLILCRPLCLLPSIFPRNRVFSNELILCIRWPKILEFHLQHQTPPMNTQDWFPLGWIGWISLLSKGLSRVFCNTTVQKHQFFSAQVSL